MSVCVETSMPLAHQKRSALPKEFQGQLLELMQHRDRDLDQIIETKSANPQGFLRRPTHEKTRRNFRVVSGTVQHPAVFTLLAIQRQASCELRIAGEVVGMPEFHIKCLRNGVTIKERITTF